VFASDVPASGIQGDDTPALAQFFLRLLEPGSGINRGMWIFLNVIFALIAFLILILYLSDVGGIHTLVFGFLLLGLTGSANWLMYELLEGKKEAQAKKDS